MSSSIFQPLTHSLTTLASVARGLVHLLVLVSRSRRALAAENLFLRKQLALFQERKVKPHRADDSTRLLMVILGRMFSWRDALVNVKPDTFMCWHRKGFRLLWR
jgi:putative transposase